MPIPKRFYHLFPELVQELQSKDVFKDSDMERYITYFNNLDSTTTHIPHHIFHDLNDKVRDLYNTYYKKNKVFSNKIINSFFKGGYFYSDVPVFYPCSHIVLIPNYEKMLQPSFYEQAHKIELGKYAKNYMPPYLHCCDKCFIKYVETNRIEDVIDLSKVEHYKSLNILIYAIYTNQELTEEQKDTLPLLMDINPYLDKILFLPPWKE